MQTDTIAPIFLHSLWRSGSTYLFNVFRRSQAGYYCFQEPLHEYVLLSKEAPDNLLNMHLELVETLRHPNLDQPYWAELRDTHIYWKDHVSKSIIYDEYFADTCSEKLRAFFAGLLEGAKGKGIPFFEECRTSNRIKALKDVFAGTHLFLCRNPWDQWWSYKVDTYFDLIANIIANTSDAPKSLDCLKKEIRFSTFHNKDILEEFNWFDLRPLTAENSYLVFYLLWCLAWIEAYQYANVIINIDQLTESESYRQDVLTALKRQGLVGLEFNDCHIHQTHFTLKEKEFFEKLELRVYEHLMSGGTSLALVEAIRRYRKDNCPAIQSQLPENAGSDVVLEDAVRGRDIVLRLETKSRHRINHVRHLLTQQQIALETQFSEKQQALQQTAEQEKADLLQHHAQHEQVLQQQLVDLRRSLVQREQEFAALQLQARQTAEQEKADLLQHHAQHEQVLQQKLADLRCALVQREQEFAVQQLQARQMAEQERNELAQCYIEQLAQQQQGFAKALQLHAEQQELLKQANSTLEAELRTQLYAQQQVCQQLKQSHAISQVELNSIYTSLTWRLTAPLRMIAGLFDSYKQADGVNSRALPEAVIQPLSILFEQSESAQLYSLDEGQAMSITCGHQTNVPVTKTIDELLAYHDHAFVRRAFLDLLGREPDHTGLSYYLARVRNGVSKLEILAQLRLSSEGLSRNPAIRGLDNAITRYRWLRRPLVGPLLSLFGVKGESGIAQRLRAIENILARAVTDTGAIQEIEKRLESLVRDSNTHFQQMDCRLASILEAIISQTGNRTGVTTNAAGEFQHSSHLDHIRGHNAMSRSTETYEVASTSVGTISEAAVQRIRVILEEKGGI